MGTALTAPICTHCGGCKVKLRRQVASSGVSQVAWRCLECDRWAENPPIWLSHAVLNSALARWQAKVTDLEIIADYSADHPCIICGRPGEDHHWAPQALAKNFGDDWPLWPMAYLCKEHHDLWHRTVTPYLVAALTRSLLA